MTLTCEEILDCLKQRPPFRFLDRLLEVDENHAVGEYTYRHDEFFYAGHFPGNPVTPGVIFAETMRQTSIALSIYLLALESRSEDLRSVAEFGTDISVEFSSVVLPGQTVRARAEKVLWRDGELKLNVELSLADGTIAASGTIGGRVPGLR